MSQVRKKGESFQDRLNRWMEEEGGKEEFLVLNLDYIQCKPCNQVFICFTMENILRHTTTNKHFDNSLKYYPGPMFRPQTDGEARTSASYSLDRSARGIIAAALIESKILAITRSQDTREWVFLTKLNNLDEPKMVHCLKMVDIAPQVVIKYYEGDNILRRKGNCFEVNHDKEEFKRGHKPKRILGDTNINGISYLLMTWENLAEYNLVRHAVARLTCPNVVETYKNAFKTQPHPKFDVRILGDGKEVLETDVDYGEILDVVRVPGGEEMFLMDWTHSKGMYLVFASEVRWRCPRLIAQFYFYQSVRGSV